MDARTNRKTGLLTAALAVIGTIIVGQYVKAMTAPAALRESAARIALRQRDDAATATKAMGRESHQAEEVVKATHSAPAKYRYFQSMSH